MEWLSPHAAAPPELLAARLSVRAGSSTRMTATFYDTFDGRLRAAGVTLRHAGGRVVPPDPASGGELPAGQIERAPRRVVAAKLSEPLRARLAPVIEMRALLPRA